MLPIHRLNRAVSITAAALTIGLAGATAHAAIYTGAWDPAFGQPFPNLGFSGRVTYFIPDACLQQSGTFACSGAAVQSAQVSFYCLVTSADCSATGPANVVEVLNLSGNGNSYNVSSITVSNNMLTGLTSGYGPAALARSSIAGGGKDLFALSFNGTGAVLAYLVEPEGNGKPVYHLGFNAATGQPTTPPTVVLTPVPEPATLALWAAGLAGIGAVVRRRRG